MAKDKILFVEDDPETANVLRLYFESQGYAVMQASWGKDGIEMSRATPPDLFVLDIRLPDMDGYEVCRQIRRNWRTSQTPVIFLTERKERDDRIAGLKLGAVDYLTKPFDIQELRLRVRNALNRAKFESLVDPITALPGNKLLDSRLNELLQREGWAVLLISIQDIEGFNERYGFVSGNEVMRATALVLTKAVEEFGTPDDFVGDPGRGDFMIITAPDRVEALRDELVKQLKRTLSYFYPVADREGTVPAKGAAKRKGPQKAVPIVSIAMGVVTDSEGKFEGVEALIAAIVAKRSVVATVPHDRP